MSQHAIISAVGPGLMAGMALACEPMPAHLEKDPRIKLHSECAFTDAERGIRGPFSGGKAVDIGGGKVAQKLTAVFDSGLCDVKNERLLVIDCSANKDVLFEGQLRDPEAPDFGTEIKSIQPPHGPIALTSSASLQGLVDAADTAGIAYSRDAVRDLAQSAKRRNRFDPYCGCKLHYPDSPGAKQ